MVLCNITFKQPFLAAPVPLLQDDKFLLRIYGILCSKEPAKIGGFRLIFSKALPKYQPLPPPLIFFFKGYQQKIEALQFLLSLSRGRGRGVQTKNGISPSNTSLQLLEDPQYMGYTICCENHNLSALDFTRHKTKYFCNIRVVYRLHSFHKTWTEQKITCI